MESQEVIEENEKEDETIKGKSLSDIIQAHREHSLDN